MAQVLRAALPEYVREHVLLPDQWKVIRAITACRTPALGFHWFQCQECGRDHFQYHSCRNRHCPLCQGQQAADWLERQERALLPVPYFHLVFTLPHLLNPLIRQNRKELYNLLFAAASQTLLQFGQRRFGGQIGITAVLHTWGQTLTDHYHLHCLVTGGALASDPSGWISAPAHYLFSVRALSKVFRGKFLAALQQQQNQLEYHGQIAALSQPGSFEKLLRQAARTHWVVYAKRPFAGPEQVLRYLSLYTHRIAISPRRLLKLDESGQTICFSYKDYADGCRRKRMTLVLPEFLRRFLLHLLPKGFVKIRHFGLLATRGRRQRIARARQHIPDTKAVDTYKKPGVIALLIALKTLLDRALPLCPHCHSHRLKLIAIIHRQRCSGKWDSS